MAKNSKDSEVVADQNVGTELEGPPQGWQEVASDRLVYKPEICQGRAVKGILMTRVELPNGSNDEPWHAYIIRTTAPTLAVDREGNAHETKVGEEVLVPETFRLNELRMAAENTAIAWEVWIKPKAQVKIGGGKTMWAYTVAVNPKSGPRTADMKFFLNAGGASAGAAPQLGAGGRFGAAQANGEVLGRDAVDVPF